MDRTNHISVCWCQRHDMTPTTYKRVVRSSAFHEYDMEILGYNDDELFESIHSNIQQWSKAIAEETSLDPSIVVKVLEREFLGREF